MTATVEDLLATLGEMSNMMKNITDTRQKLANYQASAAQYTQQAAEAQTELDALYNTAIPVLKTLRTQITDVLGP